MPLGGQRRGLLLLGVRVTWKQTEDLNHFDLFSFVTADRPASRPAERVPSSLLEVKQF